MFKIQIHATGSAGNAYSICDEDHKILIDPGIRFKELQKATGFSLSKYDLCLITHEHMDHCRAFTDTQRLGIKHVMSLGTYNAMGESGKHGLTGMISNPVETPDAEQIFHHAEWAVMPFKTIHDAAEPWGFFIHSPSGKIIVFATDTSSINSNFMGVTHWLVEANYSEKLLAESTRPEAVKDRIRASHMSIENLCEFFKRQDLSKTEDIYLIHLSDENSDQEKFKEEIEKTTEKPVYLG